MNHKAFELAISTLVIIVLGILVLIGLAYVLTGGFKTLSESTKPFLDTTTSSSIKQACSLACSNEDKLTFCCKEYDIDEIKIKCTDSRLEVSCDLSCQGYQCVNTNLPEKCNWRPTGNYGGCKAIIGVYYDGEKCVNLAGCPDQARGANIPFTSIEECRSLCENK